MLTFFSHKKMQGKFQGFAAQSRALSKIYLEIGLMKDLVYGLGKNELRSPHGREIASVAASAAAAAVLKDSLQSLVDRASTLLLGG